MSCSDDKHDFSKVEVRSVWSARVIECGIPDWYEIVEVRVHICTKCGDETTLWVKYPAGPLAVR